MRSENAAHVPRLERLSRMRDFEIDRHQPDPRGWSVVDREGRRIGDVKDLVVDTERMTATYLDVELDTKVFDTIGDRDPHVLVPIERARPDDRHLVVDDITAAWVGDVCAARERHYEEFWDRWWHRSEARTDAERVTKITRRADAGDVQKAIDDVQSGQEVRIPVITEEIVVERRPVSREERR